ncbi:MAG: hypothetical protein Q7K20_05350 [Polaromonas sp.]|nr:hypothetical protein [Polaromonas sp.]
MLWYNTPSAVTVTLIISPMRFQDFKMWQALCAATLTGCSTGGTVAETERWRGLIRLLQLAIISIASCADWVSPKGLFGTQTSP